MSQALKFMIPSARHMPAAKLGRWDGTVSFCTMGGGTYFNLLERILPLLDNVDIEVDDRRPNYNFNFPPITEDVFAGRTWPHGHPLAGEPIVLRDYQVDAINRFILNLQSLQEICTGAGKTILIAALSRIVEPVGRSLIIVPNKDLVKQTEVDYRNVGLDVGVFYGTRKEIGHQHTIATWQSLAVFNKIGVNEKLDISFEDFIKDIVCVIGDECHSTRGQELRSLLCGALAHIPIRWGLTGTIPKLEHEAICLYASIGPLVGSIKTATLQELDVLASWEVEANQTIDDQVEFSNYPEEYRYLTTDKRRLAYLTDRIHEISKTGNTLVLVGSVESGKALAAAIPDAVFVYGNTKESKREEEYSSIRTASDKVIVATYGVAAVGINIPRLFNIVLIEVGTSFVRVMQSLGRTVRRTSDKTHARIYDFCSTLRFSARHLRKRKEFYEEAQCPFTLRKIKY